MSLSPPSLQPLPLLLSTLAAVVLFLIMAVDADAAEAPCATAAVAATQSSPSAVGAAVRCLINRQRAAHRLPALQPSERLRAAAAAHSADMVARSFFDHVAPGGSTLTDRARRAGYSGRTLGEDIAWGTDELSTPAAIVEAWMDSPPHRAVILGARFREIGVGVAAGTPEERTASGAVYVLDVGRR
jgi:uncharacterized protein YkwD